MVLPEPETPVTAVRRPLGRSDRQRMDRVDGACGHLDGSQVKELVFLRFLPDLHRGFSREEGADFGGLILGNLVNGALGDDMPALFSGFRAHFDEPVGVFQDLRVVIHQDDGVAVGDQVPHNAPETFNIRGVQADGGLVQHVEHPGSPVADGPGQLDPLPLAGGEGGGLPVQGQVAQAQLQKPPGHTGKESRMLSAMAAISPGRVSGTPSTHWHSSERGIRHTSTRFFPFNPWGPGPVRQPGAAALRAGALLQKFFHPFHALLVGNLGKGIFYGVDRIEIGKVQLTHGPGVGVLIQQMDLVRGAVEDRFPLLSRQLPERNICPDSHFPGNVLHKGPHQGLPGEHSPLFDGQGLIRHQGRLVNHPDNAGAVAAFGRPPCC